MKKRSITSGNVFKRTNGRWYGVVWYIDEAENRKRKSLSGTTRQSANRTHDRI
ncbi:MAG: hypothetical protein K5768_07835 [Firmicutes bacterium]|nr:hypothetical protein [Bacillota bacterium]